MSHGKLPRGIRCSPPSAGRIAVAATFALLATGCSDPGAGIGHSCQSQGDCSSTLQCLAGTCTARCTAHLDCGDGYICRNDGTCAEVVSAVGDPCAREIDCGPAQSCRLDQTDTDGDGRLAGTCQIDHSGAATGGDCVNDEDCRTGICALDRCVELCSAASDCPASTTCVDIPRLPSTAAPPLFAGCLQASGTLRLDFPVATPHELLRVPVPSNALSFALVASIDNDAQLVGASRVTSPSGILLYATPFSQEEYYANPLRHQPEPEIATLVVPNTPAIGIETGVYDIEVGSFFEAGGMGTAIPSVSVFYKLSSATTLDLHLHFLDLADHPCPSVSGLSAQSAPGSTDMRAFLDQLESILGGADIKLGNVTYDDVDRPDLDGLRAKDLPRLLKLSTDPTGIHIFFTRSISPVGVQALAGGNPGPPALPGTRASGIAVSMDTLCYRTWTDLARITAHELGRYMGLFRNREPDGALDPIPDSDDSISNLMFFSELGGTQLSAGQASILQLYPGLR